MPVVVVTSQARGLSKLVCCTSVADLIKTAVTKLGLNMDCTYKLHVDKGEQSGLEVDEDDVLIGLCSTGGPMLTLCLVPADKEWSPAPADRPLALLNIDQQLDNATARTATAAYGANANGDNVLVIPLNGAVHHPEDQQAVRDHVLVVPTDQGICHALSMDAIVVILDAALLETKKVPPPKDLVDILNRAVRSVAQKVCDHLIRKAKDYRLATVQRYAQAVMDCNNNKYADVFARKVSGDVCGTGFMWFQSKIYNMVQYQKGLVGDKKPQKRASQASNSGSASKIGVRKVRGAYCCPNYTALLPPGETSVSQEQKRQELLEIYKNEDDRVRTASLIRETNATQREDIIPTPLDQFVPKVLPRWPFLSVPHFFLLHASILCQPKDYVGQWDCAATWDQRLASLSPDIFSYMKNFWGAESQSRRPSKRTAKAAEMLSLIDSVDVLSTEERGTTPVIIAVFQLICGYMKEEFRFMMTRVTADADEEAILEAIKVANENPIIVIKGESLYDDNVVCEVRALDHFTIKAPDVPTAYLIWFMAFQVRDFCYTQEVHRTLEFIQRFFLGLNEVGDRREVPRRNVTEVDSYVMDLAGAIHSATSPWALPGAVS